MTQIRKIAVCCFALAVHAAPQSLHGRVVDRASLEETPEGKGIAAARLSLYTPEGQKLGVKTASKSGAFRFAKLTPGRYTLTAERGGYLPFPAAHAVSVVRGDTLARDIYLDRLPLKGAIPTRQSGNKASQPGYYQRLARGMLASARIPGLFREASQPIALSRFFDARDTTASYRKLWTALLWAEIESQGRPVAARVFLAHALDSALRDTSWPTLSALHPYLKVHPDSLEALSQAVRGMIVAPGKKASPDSLSMYAVPKTVTLEVIEEFMQAKGIPFPMKKAFLGKLQKKMGGEATRRLAGMIDPPEKPPKRGKEMEKSPPELPSPPSEALWKVVAGQSAGKRPNPLALYHVAAHALEQGDAKKALADLERAGSLRPDDGRLLLAEAEVRLRLDDTAAASRVLDSMTRLDSPEWQARGYQGQARAHWKAGRGEEAERALWRSWGLDSQSDSAFKTLFLLAEVSLTRDTWKPVEAHLDNLVRARPGEAEAHYWLGRFALKKKQESAAMDRFRKAISLDRERVEYAAALAGIQQGREECDDALATLRPLREKLSGEGLTVYGECLLRLGKGREAVEEFERLHAAKPSARSLMQLAKALTAAGESKRASAVMAASPFAKDPEVRMGLAEARLDQDSAADARALIEPLLVQKESDPRLHFLLGRCAFSQRDYAAASREFTAALRYREDYPEAKYYQGLCLLKLGRGGESHHYFQELIDSDRKAWRAKGNLGQGQALAQEGKTDAAVERLRSSFQDAPTAETAAQMAFVYLRMEKPAEAADWADKATQLDKESPLALMATVDALLARRQGADALARATAGLEKHPGSCDFLMVAAKANLQTGNTAVARGHSLRARERCPMEPAPHYFLGSIATREGNQVEAKRHFDAYLKVGGDAKKVPEKLR